MSSGSGNNSLEERLRANSSAFDGLLSLIPAKYYYDEKTKDQWKAKKKSKEQVKLDKVKKLDPEVQDQELNGSALDVMKKREVNAVPVVLPGEKFKKFQQQKKNAAEKEEELEEEDEEEESIKVVFDDEGNEMPISDEISNAEEEDEEESSVDEPKLETKEKTNLEDEQEKIEKQKKLDALREKLQQKIQTLKQKRKAPGTNVSGAPSSREAILAQRKRKEDNKKKRKLQEEEEEEMESDSDDSDADEDSDIEENTNMSKKRKKNSDISTKDIMFQNIIFDDGDRVTSDLQRLRKNANNNNKKKGPSKNDVKSHLKLLETKKAKIENKDELEQIKLKEKEKWQKAMLQAEGIKLKDNEKLLRKASFEKERNSKEEVRCGMERT